MTATAGSRSSGGSQYSPSSVHYTGSLLQQDQQKQTQLPPQQEQLFKQDQQYAQQISPSPVPPSQMQQKFQKVPKTDDFTAFPTGVPDAVRRGSSGPEYLQRHLVPQQQQLHKQQCEQYHQQKQQQHQNDPTGYQHMQLQEKQSGGKGVHAPVEQMHSQCSVEGGFLLNIYR